MIVPRRTAPALLNGEPPTGNGHWIGMPPPLADGQVTFDDGTKATIPQMAQDVSASSPCCSAS